MMATTLAARPAGPRQARLRPSSRWLAVHPDPVDPETSAAGAQAKDPGDSQENFTGFLLRLALQADAESWQAEAQCARTDPDAFFPEKGGSTRDAKKVCLGCPVRAECLEYALEKKEPHGIWGGLSERERRRLKERAA